MSITAIGSSSDLSSMLRTSGLSADKIEIVQKDVEDLQNSTSISVSGAQSLDSESFRKALESRIDSDVEAGKLSEEDGDAVKQALGLNDTGSADGAEGTGSETADAASEASASGGAGRAGGGGGGGGEAEKAEVSRTETVSKGVKTTVIVYDDGSSETTTSFTSDPDTKPSSDSGSTTSAEAAKAYGQGAEAYLSAIEPGTLFDVQA